MASEVFKQWYYQIVRIKTIQSMALLDLCEVKCKSNLEVQKECSQRKKKLKKQWLDDKVSCKTWEEVQKQKSSEEF